MDASLQTEIEARIASLGFELVELEQAGSKTRPILRLRIDRESSEPGHGVTVDDCTHVSRELEKFLDETDRVSERYVLEVSSPGVERPLTKARDYERFAGKKIAVKTNETRIEGLLKGMDGDDVVIDVKGEAVKIARDNIKRAHLVFEWKEKEKGK